MIGKLQIENIEIIRNLENMDPFHVSLKLKGLPGERRKFIATQVAARRKAKLKIPEWYSHDKIVYPNTVSLEQASSTFTAKYKSGLFKGNCVADLTGGLGVDLFHFAKKFETAIYIERDLDLFNHAEYNFSILGLQNVSFFNQDAATFLTTSQKSFDLIYIDPSRRVNDRKVFRLEDSEPDVGHLMPMMMARTAKVMIKLSPLVDIQHIYSAFSNIDEVHVLAVNNECKELLVMLGHSTKREQSIRTVNMTLEGDQVYVQNRQTENTTDLDYGFLGPYLYDPNSAVRKSGLFKCIANDYHVKKLAPNSHLYTSHDIIPEFPGRIFRMMEIQSYGDFKKTGKNTRGNIAVRNFGLTADEIRKRNHMSDGGENYIFFTTDLSGKKMVIISRKV